VDVSENLILVEFGRILKLVKLGRLFRYRVDVNRNIKLINSSRFFRFWFRV